MAIIGFIFLVAIGGYMVVKGVTALFDYNTFTKIFPNSVPKSWFLWIAFYIVFGLFILYRAFTNMPFSVHLTT